MVDAWIDALQNSDASAARGVQRGFAQSPEGRELWAETMADAQADRLQQQPWPSPHDRVLDRHTAVIDPDRASERPLQQTMQQFEEETLRQEQGVIAAQQQRQMQQSQNGMAR